MDKSNDYSGLGLNLFKEDGNYEVENQFILRLPPAPAAVLKSVVASGVLNLKDRLSIQVEQDMKHGTIRFDSWILNAKIVDLPCIIESHKTLDKKNFYKTADICQMMVCTEENEEAKDDKKEEKKDNKDKRFIFPHGITPPLKNARKKRFRKTLKKKTVDVPEIEKEVKRLFRTDTEAIATRYEVVDADDEKPDLLKQTNLSSPGNSGLINTNSQSMDLVEHDLFGQVLSSSDDEDTRAQDSDDASRMSMGLPKIEEESINTSYITEFPKGLLLNQSMENSSMKHSSAEKSSSSAHHFDIGNESVAEAVASLESQTDNRSKKNNENLMNRLSVVEIELEDIVEKRRAQELEIASIENFALQQRFQKEINDLKVLEAQKRKEYEDILTALKE